MSDDADEALNRIMAHLPDTAPIGPCIDDAKLLAHRDRRSTEQEGAVIEKHLASCADCRAVLAELHGEVSPVLEAFGRASLQKRRPWRALVSGLAIAAGVVFATLRIPAEVRLPEYDLRGPLGGVASARGSGQSGSQFVPSSIFTIELAPRSRVETQPAFVVLVDTEHGQLVRAPSEGTTIGEGGTFRYQLEAERLFGSRFGRRAVRVAIIEGAPPGALGGSEREVRDELGSHRWLAVDVDYGPQRQGEEQ
jgi:hypothetical protein